MAFQSEGQQLSAAGSRPFFPEPGTDAVMGSLLGLTSELLLLSVRQRRMEEALRAAGAQLPPEDAGLTPPERQWLQQRADALVAAWLAPFGAAT